jgi:hypothetical protein
MFDSTAHAGVYLQLRAEDISQTRWDNITKGRVTHAFLPGVTTELAALSKPDFMRTQVFTGHGEFGCHLYRIGKEDLPRRNCRSHPRDPRMPQILIRPGTDTRRDQSLASGTINGSCPLQRTDLCGTSDSNPVNHRH